LQHFHISIKINRYQQSWITSNLVDAVATIVATALIKPAIVQSEALRPVTIVVRRAMSLVNATLLRKRRPVTAAMRSVI